MVEIINNTNLNKIKYEIRKVLIKIFKEKEEIK